jgi:hypothetical protein
MMKSIGKICVVLFAFGVHPVVAQTVPGSDFYVGNWLVFATHDPDSGTNSCTAVTAYHNDSMLLLTTYPDGSMQVGIDLPSEAFSYSDVFAGTITTNRGQIFSTMMVSRGAASLVTEHIPSTTEILEAIKRASYIDISNQFGSWIFRLDGSSNAISAALQCTAQYRNYSTEKIPETSSISRREILDLQYQIALRRISAMGIRDVDFIDAPAEASQSPWSGLTWEGLNGAYVGRSLVVEIEDEKLNLATLQGQQINNAAVLCGGNVRNVADIIVSGDMHVMNNFVICNAKGHEFNAHFQSVIVDRVYVETLTLFYTNNPSNLAPNIGWSDPEALAASFSQDVAAVLSK